MITSVTNAHNAYRQSIQNAMEIKDGSPASPTSETENSSSFEEVMSHALKDAINTGRDAEQQAKEGLNGHGDMTQIVTAVSNAQLALHTATTLRDRMVQAYQDIMRMSI